MWKKLWIFMCVAAIGAWAVPACDDGGDGDGDSDGDVDSDADGDADSDGDTDSDGDADGDDGWPCTQGDTMQFRLTALQISSPAALASPLIQSILDDSINNFRFIWAVEVDGTTMMTGSATTAAASPAPEDAEFCEISWNEAPYDPQSVDITMEGNTFSTDGAIESLEIPVYSESDPVNPLLTLPMQQVSLIDVTMSDDHILIGTPPNNTNFAQNWTPDGTLTGYLSFAAAQEVEIEDLGGQTLCQLLCGLDCEVTAPADCPSPPVEIPGTGEQGFMLEAEIGAGAVTIE